jgi:hypothetical protein
VPKPVPKPVSKILPWLAVLCAWQMPAATAAAQPTTGRPAIAAAAGGEDDVTRSVLVGPGGQVYSPAGPSAPGTWQRRFGGGTASAVLGAVRVGQALFVHGEVTPVFRLEGTAWHASPLPNRGPCALGRGPVAALGIGRHVYTWRDSGWARLGSIPGVVSAVWAGTPARAYAASIQGGLWRLQGNAQAAVPTVQAAGDPVVLLAGQARLPLYGVTRGGAVLRIRERATLVDVDTALAGWAAHVAATDASGTLWALGWIPASGEAPARAVLARTQGNTLIAVETLAGLAPGERFTVLLLDRDGGMLWATESGTLRYRAGSASAKAAAAAATPDPTSAGWRDGHVQDELPLPPSAFPGRGPARVR